MDTVLIFGATGVTGEALARRLYAQKRAIHLTGRDTEPLTQLASELGVRYTVCDVLDPEQIRSAVTDATEEGPLGGLAYCVGSIVMQPFRRLDPAILNEAFALNVTGAALAVQAASDALRKGRGSVVLFGSVAGERGFSNHAVIGTVKAAVTGLSRSLAAELSPSVRVNCIAPSLSDTKMGKVVTGDPKIAENVAKMHPLRRLGTGDDLAAAAAFLLSEDAGWITGQVIGVDGGRSSLILS